jgi:AAA+ ATPase superfamily predicted ATPase
MFNTGSPVKGTAFIDRTKHLPLFRAFIDNHQHFMIKAPRRFGKTSVVKHIFEHEGGYRFIYVDVKKTLSIQKLAHNIIDQVYQFLGVEGFVRSVIDSSKDSFVGFLKRLQSVKIDSVGEITIQELSSQKDAIELLLYALDLVNSVATRLDSQIYFIFDEFQDIISLSDKTVLSRMRSTIQHHERVTYIFLGSIETIMNKIFQEKKSPFFHFARIVDLPPLDVSEVFAYAQSIFSAKGVKNPEMIQPILAFTLGHPDYTMQALQRLYFTVITQQIVELSVTIIIDTLLETIASNEAYIVELITYAKQKKHHLEVLSDIANQRTSKIESKTLYNVRSSLENMGFIIRVGLGTYRINDILLSLNFIEEYDSKPYHYLQTHLFTDKTV